MVVRLFAGAVFVLLSAMLATPAAAEFRIESLDFNFPEEISDAASKEKLLVIMFHQAGCPYCDKMRSRVFPDPKVDSYYSKKFIMIESNIRGNLDVVTPDGAPMTERKMAKKLRVRATPVFMFFDKKGKQALRLTGFLNADLFVRAGKYVADGVHEKKVSFYRYLKGAE